ncbi:hypothetical protein AALP_AA8G374000 [Arabis alpina]|uniref:E3 ubiquitin-protein ligase listerin n=1 Tax=Arabis alpina TaxID=50452 RepID=A0A087GBW7_ARAAL|nr:hypothetical protein AALP_AA8G374000 [Arabis alpina]
MGKPKGDAARSKARPSSSSLAASLLPSGSATAAVGFGGYVGSSRFEASMSNEDSASFLDLDSEVSQHLQRLSRKDPTTKIKAFASLSELVKQKKGKELVPIIPQWTFEYKKLILDYNRDVRRATHDVMNNIVTGVGRDLAPHLKSIMGPWWYSQFDLASEVSQAAKSSLQAAFPAQEKRLDALNLCSAEIFAYLEENLKLTPQNLSDKALASDELEEMHQQMISSSLVALATLLDILLREPDKTGSANINAESKLASKARSVATSSAEKLFSFHKCFLNFLKSESPSIRSATYTLLSSFIKNVPQVFGEGDVRCLAPALLGVFRENNPACHSSMWEAVLLFSRKFPQSWAHLNIHKSVLNHLWQFLKNGCFGSPRVSYPALILFLEVMPIRSVEADKFFVNFFKNLLAGRSMCESSRSDQLSLLRAATECFLWGLRNASRYCDDPNSIHDLQVDLIDKVLVKILWADFFDLSKGSIPPIPRKSAEALSMGNSVSYLQELGRCILEILSGINLLEQNLLSFFCNAVQESFLNTLQQENVEIVTGSMRKMIDFLLLFERYSVLEGESWPLDQFMGPLLSKAFPCIKSSESFDGLKLLSVSASVFGPRKIVPVLIRDVETSTLFPSEKGRDMSPEKFVKAVQEIFIPWCMDGCDSLTPARQDLLLSLLDDECFTQQWSDVISYVYNEQDQGFSNLAAMKMLLEKARKEITKRSSGQELNQRIGSQADHWHHRLIESTAISLVRSSPTTSTSTSQFLCSVLGGSTEDSSISFVSRSSLVLIYREILEKLLSFIKQSPLCSVNDTFSSLIVEAVDIEFDLSSSVDVIVVAKFAAEVIDGSFFSLKALNQDVTLFSAILSSIFIIDLESRMTSLVDNTLYEFKEERKDRNLVCDLVHAVCSKMNNQFWKSINYDARKSSASILVQSMRSVVLLEDDLQPSQLTLLCVWMTEVLEYHSLDQSDEENLCGLLLLESNVWPMWVSPSSSASINTYGMPVHLCELRKFRSQRYVSFINSLIMKMGIHRFLVDHKDNEFASQAWLSAEILCTWEWPGGNAQNSFLPTLVSFCKSEPTSGSLLNSIFDILLNGALVHGEDERESLGSMWVDFNNHIEDVEEPFLRALVSLLSTLFKEDLWREEEAMAAFKMLTDKLFIGEETSKNCLRISPFIMSIIISPLRSKIQSDVSGEDTMPPLDVFLGDWLERSLSFPPLVLWQSAEDMQDWFQLVVSCYPVSEKANEAKELQRHVSDEEGTLLLDLFRKQRQAPGASSVVSQLPAVQILLARLIMIAVTYCGNDFNAEDWDFVFSNLKRLIQSAVVVMEETSENVNDFISGVSSIDNENDTLEGLGHIVSVSDSSIDNAKNALSAFSLLNALVKPKPFDSLNSLAYETWDPVKDRILEGVLRLFFCTGLAEAIAASYSTEAASIVASFRADHLQFWELVAQLVVDSSPRARDRAVRAVEFWGLSKGAISALYAIMFSSNPIPALQLAAYIVLSTEPISRLAIVADGNVSLSDESLNDQESSNDGLPSEDKLLLRDEISCMVEKLNLELLDTDLTAPERVQTFLGWSLLLSHVNSLPSLTQGRERLVHYIERTANPLILDSLFQHIPLELYMAQSLKKKDGEIPSELSVVASAATRAITTGSSLSTVESLWPIETGNMASLAGVIYGLMLRVLPAYVREWFSEIRDRSASSSIETFTRLWCSPSLIENELSQINKADFKDESFKVRISKAANEVVATYTKDETEMDLVICLPVSYPLRPVDVSCTKSIGITDAKQRKWLMSMLMFVRNQNGALAEAIRIWKRNSDKEFEGVEDCPICYSVIHTVNHSLPRRACVTCKYKFHKACLDKWFYTSHKKLCPLCQSPC